MKRRLTLLTVLFSLLAIVSEAQWGGGVYIQRGYRRPPPPPPPYRRHTQRQPAFKPTVNLSIGYGFPNLDKDQLAEFYDSYKGTATQMEGPITGALDFQFSRYSSIGIMGTYGKVTVPYYDFASSSPIPTFEGHLENWSLMFNMVNYMPASRYVSPYIRTAIGINNWKQDYVYPDGQKAAILDDPSSLAYQVSIGTRFNFSQNAGFYLEAGYGKYIVNGGLTFRF